MIPLWLEHKMTEPLKILGKFKLHRKKQLDLLSVVHRVQISKNSPEFLMASSWKQTKIDDDDDYGEKTMIILTSILAPFSSKKSKNNSYLLFFKNE